MEKVSKRVNAIQEVKESVKLLTQLLADYNKDTSSHDNEELIKVRKQMHTRPVLGIFILRSTSNAFIACKGPNKELTSER